MIPVPGRSVSGGGLRAWGLGEALRSRGHDVVYSVPDSLVPEGDEHEELRALSFRPEEIHRTVLRAEPDVLLVEQWGLATYMHDIALPVVIDLHGSLILENAFRQHRTLTSNAAAKIKALHKADLVLCPAVRQRAYFMSWLMMSGADPTDLPIEVVPVSMPPELPERAARSDEEPLNLVFGGQLWPWIEAETALRAAADVLGELGSGTCHLFVEEPKRVDVMRYDDSTCVRSRPLDPALADHPSVKVEGFLPREKLLERYATADLAIDVYSWNSERELAYTTRTVEYLWCGVPVVYGDYGELAPLIKEWEAGWVVRPGDEGAIRAAIEGALADRAELRRRSENARRLVKERLTWDRTVAPLDAFVREPAVRDKGQTIFGRLALEFDRIDGENREHVEALEQQLARSEQRLADESGARERRITALSDELARQDRRFTELVERHGRESAGWDREQREMERCIAELRNEVRQITEEVSEARDLLRCEQDDHAQTSSRLELERREAAVTRHQLAEREGELDVLRADLKTAVDRIAAETGERDARIEGLEQLLREVGQRELELRTDLANEVAQGEGLRGELAAARRRIAELQDQIDSAQQMMGKLKAHWLQRTVATGQHSLRRVASQVPALAGLFVRNLANNAHMAIWQKRHNVRIFPGQ
jgi:glycosyltransferase involved in cell wall biosynthesis